MTARWLKGLLLAGLCALGIALAMGVAVIRLLAPAPGEWSHPVAIGPWSQDISVPAVLRIARHPFVLRLVAGRTWNTPFGPLRWEAMAAPNTWRAICTPCTLPSPGLGHAPLRLARAELTVVPDIQGQLQGSFALGESSTPLQGRWSSRVEAQRLTVNFQVTREPADRLFALFPNDIPELAHARIEGRLSGNAQWALPSRTFTIKPRVDGLRVAGLGTEALLNAESGCGPAETGADFGVWLPRAVMAAEDQRFYEHPGFDLAEILSAWAHNRREGEPAHGASTLNQQLAKLIYTGDSRTHGRKLRELLYAVEIDRTLGKARTLHLYLSLVPWGDGQCGAHAASARYFGKPPHMLTPMEAVWLASLLHNPDRELSQLAREGRVNIPRVAWVAGQLRPMPRREREALQRAAPRWMPPHPALSAAMTVSAAQAAAGR